MKQKKTTFPILIFSTLLFVILTSKAFSSIDQAANLYSNSKSKYKNEQITYELVKSKYYFSAIPFARIHIKTIGAINRKFEKVIETLILKTGVDSFIDISATHLTRHNSTVLMFVLGIKQFKNREYKESLKAFAKIPEGHRFEVETRITKGSILNLLGKYEHAAMEYDSCQDTAKSFEKKSKNFKLKRYYAILRESCQIHIARMNFKQKKYSEAIGSWGEISKKSYRWPYLLIEKAWANYYLKDYNRTLGLLVTYKSPLLRSYFLPEAEVLTAISYFRLCLWGDAMEVINQYYSVYKPKSDDLRRVIAGHTRSKRYFLDLVANLGKKNNPQTGFIRNLVIQVSKKIKFSLDYASMKRAENELDHLEKFQQTKFVKLMRRITIKTINRQVKSLNYFVKKQFYKFINNIHYYSAEMFKIRLEVVSKKRTLVYTDKKLVSTRSRGSLKNVNRRFDQHFWTFRGEFWADEIGDYSFGLKSNCKYVKDEEKI